MKQNIVKYHKKDTKSTLNHLWIILFFIFISSALLTAFFFTDQVRSLSKLMNYGNYNYLSSLQNTSRLNQESINRSLRGYTQNSKLKKANLMPISTDSYYPVEYLIVDSENNKPGLIFHSIAPKHSSHDDKNIIESVKKSLRTGIEKGQIIVLKDNFPYLVSYIKVKTISPPLTIISHSNLKSLLIRFLTFFTINFSITSLIISFLIIHLKKKEISDVGQINNLFLENQNKNEFIKNVFNASQNAIIAIQSDNIISELNNSTLIMFDYERDELIGSNYAKLFPEDEFDILNKTLIDFKTDIDYAGIDPPFLGETRGLRKDGMEFPVKILIGKHEGVRVISCIDISQEKKWANGLIEAKRNSELANQTKSEFLNNISHELRTPLHAIINFSNFGKKKLRKEEMPSRTKLLDYFENIYISAERQLNLVNDLLDLSKMEAGKYSFSFQNNKISESIHISIITTKPQAQARNISIETHLSNDIDEFSFDQDRINQVLINLLSNAIKFSPDGGVISLTSSYTTFHFSDSSLASPGIQISVCDQGPGLDNEDMEMLFDKFYQSKKTKKGGTGLGLSICREIIIAHKGHIEASNNLSGGANFTFILPITSEIFHEYERNT